MKTPSPLRGRGSASNPKNRFEALERVSEPMGADEVSSPATQFLPDHSKSVIVYNDSPDLGFDASVNPYRGCEHGCVYCYARPTHEYLGFSAGLDFETKIVVKADAPRLLRKELSSPKWKPRVLAMSGVTDCYQPVEKRLELTRRCLEVLLEFRNPVTIVTKNYLVTRDIDLLSQLARYQCAAVFISLTTLDEKLSGLMEPRASRPARRLAAIEALARASIPVGFLLAPMIPGLTDSEAPAIAQAAAGAGARFASYVALRLPHGVKELFENWLEQHYPGKKDKILNRVRAVRSGKLNDPRFHSRMKGEGIFAEQMAELFRVACKKAGIHERAPRLSTEQFRRPTEQLSLFNHSAA
jgi:DNA repair photolyase